MKQCEWILWFMGTFGSITPKDAYEYGGIMRLASRICDLRKAGYHIRSENVRNEKTGRTHAKYTLIEEDDS